MSGDPRWSADPQDRDDGSRDLGRGERAGSDAHERDQVDSRDVFMSTSRRGVPNSCRFLSAIECRNAH